MDQVIPALIAELLKYGLAGVVICYLIFKIYKLEGEKAALIEKNDELQEKRINETIKSVMAFGATAAGSEKLAEAQDVMSRAVNKQSDLITELVRLVGGLSARRSPRPTAKATRR